MLALIFGLIMLTLGGEALIRGSLGTAKRLNVSPLLCGIVIVGFGTSAPELAVSVDAIRADNPGIAVGNVIGSNIGNILLILGLCALLSPLSIKIDALKRDLMVLLISTGGCCVLISVDLLNLWSGTVLLLGLLSYVFWVYREERTLRGPPAEMHSAETALVTPATDALLTLFLMLIIGLGLLILGANLFLQGAINLATEFSVSSTMIGLSLVAVGTSLPELTISVIAVLRKQSDVAIGNVLGSNIFNILGILGLTAVIKPISVSSRMVQFDQWIMLGTAVALFVILNKWKKISRLTATIAMGSYIVYLWCGMMYFNI